jgi:2-polyprenyl-3-methyl-5-hydroxy-6-metoxy-1,4-benzoquinol methylase
MKALDEKTQSLESIVPEYESGSRLVKWLFHKRLAWATKQVQKHTAKKDIAILDAGCGNGIWIKKLAEQGYTNLHGIDFNEHVVEIGIPGAQFKCGDLAQTGYKDQQFDVIAILDVIEHIPDPTNVIIELKRILKPNGILLASLPTEHAIYKLGRFILKGTFSSEDGPATGVHYHNAKGLHKMLKTQFKPKSIKYLPLLPPCNLFNLRSYTID